jgi:hypothetical protein
MTAQPRSRTNTYPAGRTRRALVCLDVGRFDRRLHRSVVAGPVQPDGATPEGYDGEDTEAAMVQGYPGYMHGLDRMGKAPLSSW